MESLTLINETIVCLKDCYHWRNDKNATIADKIIVSQYLGFIDSLFSDKNERGKVALHEFENDYSNLKFEGKLEGWIETVLEVNSSIKSELEKKNNEIKEYANEKNRFRNNVTQVVQEVKQPVTQVIETKIEAPIEKQTTQQTQNKEESLKTADHISQNEKDDKNEIIFYEEDADDNDLNIEVKQGPIIVPWDFSDVAEYALQHAIMYARHMGGEILLLHIVKKDKEIPMTTIRFQTLVEDIKKKYNFKPGFIIREGNIFSTISEIADTTSAKLVIMGTHGIKGMQKLTGSYALKVITGTNSPFIVVQTSPSSDTVKTIVFPVDHTRESKQKLKQAKILATHFPHVRFKICKQALIPSTINQRNTTTNIAYIKSYFRQCNIEHDVVNLDCTDLIDGTLKYVAVTQPDLVVILTTKNISLGDYMLGAEEQKVIANEARIPVMCINPMKMKFRSLGSIGI